MRLSCPEKRFVTPVLTAIATMPRKTRRKSALKATMKARFTNSTFITVFSVALNFKKSRTVVSMKYTAVTGMNLSRKNGVAATTASFALWRCADVALSRLQFCPKPPGLFRVASSEEIDAESRPYQ